MKYILQVIVAACVLEMHAQVFVETHLEGDSIHLSWTNTPGTTYRILGTLNVGTTPWVVVTNMISTNVEATLSLKIARSRSYFRIEERKNPLYGCTFSVDPNSNARKQEKLWLATDPKKAAEIAKIANTSQANWILGTESDTTAYVENLVRIAKEQHAALVLVAYNIPKRDCLSYSAGGATTSDAYLTWCEHMRDGIGTNHVVVVLEPDALARMDCLSESEQIERLRLLAEAVNIFAALPYTDVYIDAGHKGMVSETVMAGRLKAANIENARGFALNVSNFYRNQETITYGKAISKLLNDAHFIIDTSRNGAGASTDTHLENPWCNPPGRLLGVRTTGDTGEPLVDGFLWIKRPGESDGNCRPGEPPAGAWWPEYALDIAQRSTF